MILYIIIVIGATISRSVGSIYIHVRFLGIFSFSIFWFSCIFRSFFYPRRASFFFSSDQRKDEDVAISDFSFSCLFSHIGSRRASRAIIGYGNWDIYHDYYHQRSKTNKDTVCDDYIYLLLLLVCLFNLKTFYQRRQWGIYPPTPSVRRIL